MNKFIDYSKNYVCIENWFTWTYFELLPPAEDPSIRPVLMRPLLPILFDPDAVETEAFAAADSNFWHDVRETGTFIWDTKSFIDVVPKM